MQINPTEFALQTIPCRELTTDELEAVSGGVIPIIIAFVIGACLGYAAARGYADGKNSC